MSELKEKVEELLVKYKGIGTDLFTKEKWDSIAEVIKNISTLSKLCIDTIVVVEIASKEIEGIKSEDKLVAACQALDELIVFPWYLEITDQYLFQILLSFGVRTLNAKFGNDWNLDQLRENLELGIDILTIPTIS
jgi:hypothetical protein